MASIIKCTRGHYYDVEKNKDCPYCKKQDEEQQRNAALVADHPQFQMSSGDLDDGATMAMYPSGGEIRLGGGRMAGIEGLGMEGEGVTVGLFSKAQGTSYVTGWLVGRNGPVKGRDYRIGHGRNWVGRSFNSDIIISEAPEIAMKGQCAIVYDNRSLGFFLVPGTGSIGTYLNEELLTGPKQLKAGDQIRMGESIFDFVPYCREGHIWEEEEK